MWSIMHLKGHWWIILIGNPLEDQRLCTRLLRKMTSVGLSLQPLHFLTNAENIWMGKEKELCCFLHNDGSGCCSLHKKIQLHFCHDVAGRGMENLRE